MRGWGPAFAEASAFAPGGASADRSAGKLGVGFFLAAFLPPQSDHEFAPKPLNSAKYRGKGRKFMKRLTMSALVAAQIALAAQPATAADFGDQRAEGGQQQGAFAGARLRI